MGKRGPQKLINKILEEIKEDESGKYLIVYDIKGKIPNRFYQNLNELHFEHIQKSVILTNNLKTALAIKRLVKYYNGEARIFKIEREI